MAGLLSDLRFALRTLFRSPLFTAVAILSLALGIGANTAIFTLMDQLILRLLPVKEPEQLVMIWSRGPHNGSNWGSRMLSYPMYQDYQQKAEAFDYVFCRREWSMALTIDGKTERTRGEMVSGNFFDALGVRPAAGRLFSPAEDDRTYKGHPVAVLTHDYWVSRFAAQPDVVGKKILVNNYPMTIVGVAGAGFYGLDPTRATQVYVPIQMSPLMLPSGVSPIGDRRTRWINVFGRLKPGFTAQSAQASLEPLFKQIINDEVKMPAFVKSSDYIRRQFLTMTPRVDPAGSGYSQMREQASIALFVLMSMVGLVLLIACANVANLLIARAAARQKEIAVRLSIGASRWQLMRQLMTESILLALAGGALGTVLAVWTTRALLSFLPEDTAPLLLKAEPDLRILGFTFTLCLLTGIIFGLAPALRSTRFDLWSALKDVVGSIAGGGAVGLRKGLVAAQVALSFLLLFGAGLFVRSLQNLKEARTGFENIERVNSFEIAPALVGYPAERGKILYKQILEDVRSLPGVRMAGIAMVSVLSGDEWDSTMSVEGHQSKDGENMQAYMNFVSPGYFQAMGVPLLEGRDFEDKDAGTESTVAIVNRKFAEHFFGTRSAIGRHIGYGLGPDTKLKIRIVGVAEDTLYEGPREGVRRQVFLPLYQQEMLLTATYYVRTDVDPESLFPAMRASVAKFDQSVPAYNMRTVGRQLDQTLMTERLIASLAAGFGALATLLAAIGLYGVMAFVVVRRTKEIGVRMALGAERSSVLWLVLKEVMLLVGIGLAIGLPLALFLGRYVSSQLYGVTANDPTVAGVVVILLIAVSALAGVIPARRAASIDPMIALRYE